MAWWEKLGEGIRVVRASKAIASEALFNITVGKVLVTLLVGEIDTVINGSGANVNTQLEYDGAGPPTDAVLCGTTDIDAYPAGDILGITGLPTDNLLPATAGGSIPGMTTKGLLLGVGAIDLITEGITDNSEVTWTLFYRPIDQGAIVVAAA